MQQQSRLPLRRMKAQIFSCVIWKVASSIILWAHAGTDEEDDHYVFTTALNTAPPGCAVLVSSQTVSQVFAMGLR